MPHFLYRLIAPRPSFPFDMTPEEAAAMKVHGDYWQGLTDRGTCLIYGPVLDPRGPWGLAIVEAEGEAEAQAIFAADPALEGARCTFETAPIQVAAMRQGGLAP